MTRCRRHICTNTTHDKPFCSDRCERLYSPGPSPDDIERDGTTKYNQIEERSRYRVVNNVVNQR